MSDKPGPAEICDRLSNAVQSLHVRDEPLLSRGGAFSSVNVNALSVRYYGPNHPVKIAVGGNRSTRGEEDYKTTQSFDQLYLLYASVKVASL